MAETPDLTASTSLAEQALENLVNQFARPLDFLRELVPKLRLVRHVVLWNDRIVTAWLVLAIIGGLFVMEALSVIIQVGSFKLTGRRVFRMAPIHHHFEKMGWSEPTVVIRFWIVAVILALIGLATLKIR